MDLLKEVKREKLKKRIIIGTVVVIILAIVTFITINRIRNKENDLINKCIVNANKNSIIVIDKDMSKIKLYPNTLKDMKENSKRIQVTNHEASFLLNTDYLQERNKIDAKVTTTNKYQQINNVVCIETDITKMEQKSLIDTITVKTDKMNIDTEYVDIYAINNNDEFIAYRLKEQVTNHTVTINLLDDNINKYIVAYVPVNNLSLNYDEINLKKGEEITLTWDLNENATNSQLHAKVADENIIEISSNGTIKAINAGTTQLIIQSYKNTVLKTINVIVKEIPEEIKVNKEKVEIYAGETYQIEATVLPEAVENKNIKYSSSNNNVVTVNSKGKITGIKKGTAKITMTTEETPEVSKEISITVKEKPLEISIERSEIELYINDTYQLNVTVLPETLENKKLKYTTSNKKVATVDKKGKIKAVAEGRAEITITTDLKPALSLKVIVYVKKNETADLEPENNTIQENTINQI